MVVGPTTTMMMGGASVEGFAKVVALPSTGLFNVSYRVGVVVGGSLTTTCVVLCTATCHPAA